LSIRRRADAGVEPAGTRKPLEGAGLEEVVDDRGDLAVVRLGLIGLLGHAMSLLGGLVRLRRR
jgi:hypothetical protein